MGNQISQNPFEILCNQLNRIKSLLLDLKLQKSEAVGLVTKIREENGIELAVRITGLKRQTIYNLVSNRKIPHAKRGKKLYFDEQLHAWIAAGNRPTVQEIRDAAWR